MKLFKKSICLILTLVFVLCISSGCTDDTSVQDDGKLKIVTTIFPEYDWVCNILGDNKANVDVVLLNGTGTDLHSFQPSVDDIITIKTADLFIYVGGESNEWVADVLEEKTNQNMIVLDLLVALGNMAKTEVNVEGMQTEDEHAEDDEYDEHIWLSLKNAQSLCLSITDALAQVDSDNAELYFNNARNYIEKLTNLDYQYTDIVNSATNKVILFGDRFPFRYLADDYNIKYYAAFNGCSAETEASFETITFLAKKIDEYKIKTVLTLKESDDKIAQTIIANTTDNNQKILKLDSMQSTTLADIENNVTYLSIMESNLNVLKEALNF